ncbi:type IV secretory system conjugative DNA transfer family protein [Bradyrhizobium sp. 61]|uniref:type IV secretory system conjugative DNA transfer family protein n=1 Tax=Bradyrhizobium sp. 61 TaxID=2782679 RepID=UPI001FFB3752|nr:type IV secretory system conjugative DNA transfer family protein [Bradyrhizobium sp. 61]MCK1281772.1 type IV secretory system conjugative DNA transfer family protein [Bradyrhizobium sp. 61]
MHHHFPPRGSNIRGASESSPSQVWCDPADLDDSWTWSPGRVLLGRWGDRWLGRKDGRHVMTIAGTQAGKSSSVLIPNLRRYPGSVVVLDPKGELAAACAEYRRTMGQHVYILDPFEELGQESASYNPFSELGLGRIRHIAPDVSQSSDALIINNARDPHWTDAGKNLTRGDVLLTLAERRLPTLRGLRRFLCSTPPEMERRLTAMANTPEFDGIISNIGSTFLGKLTGSPREMQSILSTVQEQTAPLDDVLHITERSDFRLADLNTGKLSIFLVLPGMRMGTHFRWLRLIVQQALSVLERAPVPRGKLPVWFVLEEFPTLGHMRSLETAAGLMAGFGVKLWSVLQDLTQLQTNYPKSWETFLGNAGIIQAFGNVDLTTTEYLSRMLGNTQIIETQDIRVSGGQMSQGDLGRREHVRNVRLLENFELRQHFAAEACRQLVIVPGSPPVYMNRLEPEGRETA